MSQKIETAQIRSKSIILYDRWEDVNRSQDISKARKDNMSIQREKRYSGKMTKGARLRLRKAIDIMVQSIQPKWIYNEVSGHPHIHKLSFITLTVSSTSQMLSAAEGYKLLLRPFLQWLTKYQGCKMYVWKAELQKRGQIHYHITTPTYVRYDLIKSKWNQLQQKNGLLDDYFAKKGHYNANSTDVHEVYKVKDVAAYLSKYLAKEIDSSMSKEAEQAKKSMSTVGKVWDCSMSLKKAKYYQTDVSSYTKSRISQLLIDNKAEVYSNDHCTIIKIKDTKPTTILTQSELATYQLHMKAIRDGHFDDYLQKQTADRIKYNDHLELLSTPATNVNQPSTTCEPAVKQRNLFNLIENTGNVAKPISYINQLSTTYQAAVNQHQYSDLTFSSS